MTSTRKTHTTAVVLIPPHDIWPSIQELRRTHDRNFTRWMPHITMLYPFAEREDFPAAASQIKKAAAETEAFEIRLAQFDHFRHRKNCTIFLAPHPKDSLTDLHANLIRALPEFDDTAKFRRGFHPHLSIGQFQHGDVERETQRLQADWSPIQFAVSEISLIYRAPETEHRFVVAQTFPLTG